MQGSGTQADPYIVTTPAELHGIGTAAPSGTYYKIGNDIDMTGYAWGSGYISIPAGVELDGNNKTVSNLTAGASNSIGAFIRACYGTVKNLILKNVNISSNDGYCGGFVDLCYSGAVITNCQVSGTLSPYNSGAGGFVSLVYSGATISKCKATVDVNSSTTAQVMGGFVSTNQGTIVECESYSTNLKTTYTTSPSYVGGFVGTQSGTSPLIQNCGAHASTISGGYYEGGFCGNFAAGTISQCVSTTTVTASTNVHGGFLGVATTGLTVTSCYYDSDKGTTTKAAATTSYDSNITALTSAQMQVQANFSGLDFTTRKWKMGANYPIVDAINVLTYFLVQDGTDIKKGTPGYAVHLTDLVPDMTSDTAPAPFAITASAAPYTGHSNYQAFDNDPTSSDWYIFSTTPPTGGHWIKVDFGAGNGTVVNQISLKALIVSAGNNSLKDFQFYGSNDNSNWTLLTSGTQVNNANLQTYNFVNSTPYRYYRLNVLTSYYVSTGATVGAIDIQFARSTAVPGTWSIVGTAPVAQAMFDSDGMADVSSFTDDDWRLLSTTNPEILISTDADTPPEVTVDGLPAAQVVVPNQSLSLVGQIQSVAASVVESGAGVVRMAISGDGGVTWNVFTRTIGTTTIIPPMTSATTPAPYVVSTSAEYSPYYAYKAFDGVVSASSNQGWFTNTGAEPTGGHWLQIDLGAGNEKAVTAISIFPLLVDGASSYGVKNWSFSGSDDNVGWTALDSGVTANSANEDHRVFSNVHAYRYYKLTVVDSYYATTPSELGVEELRLFESIPNGWTPISIADLNAFKTNGITAGELSLATPDVLSLIDLSDARIAFYLEQTTATDKATVNFAEIDTSAPIYSPAVNGITVVYDAIDEQYYGLLFMDLSQAYYSTSFGDILQYLDFGTLIAGQTSLEVKVILRNNYNFSVNNLRVFSTNSPAYVTVELSKTTSPFISQSTLAYSTILDPDQTIEFYVRLTTTLAAKAGGNFNIRVTADAIS